MNIETNIKDVIVSPPDSTGSKMSFGSDDSLEYSNDDRSVANKGKGDGMGDLDKPKDNFLPPKYPPIPNATFDQTDASMFTPQRKQPTSLERLPGPLNLFSPGLSPIVLTNYSQCVHEDIAEVENRYEDDAYPAHDVNMRDSMDSLEMTSPYFKKVNRETPDDAGPNYQFWRNKLFSNEMTADVACEQDLHVEKQSILFPTPDGPNHHTSFIRSNSNSFDSDFNLTPRHSLIYPTTYALYERSAAVSPKSADVSMDSDMHSTRQQSLVYPTTAALYERSTHLSGANASSDDCAHAIKQALAHSSAHSSFGRSTHEKQGQGQGQGTPSADISLDSDAHVAHQSLIYPTTAALYERTARRSADSSFDSEQHVTKQSLVHPTTSAALSERPARPHPDDSIESDTSLMQQSYLRQPMANTMANINLISSRSPDLSRLSMLDRNSEEDALGQSLHSISLLPGSPASSPALKQRVSHFMFPPPRPNGISPSNTRSLSGARSDDKHAALPSSSAPHLSRQTGQQVSSSDTEYANSTAKRRQAEQQARRGGQAWREAEDVPPSGAFSSAPTSARTTSTTSGARSVEAVADEIDAPRYGRDESNFNADDDLSVSPPGPPSPSSVSAWSPSTGAEHFHLHRQPQQQYEQQHHQHQHQHQHAEGIASSSLVVGGLYTLQVDSRGRPAFVPVLLDQHATAGVDITFSSPLADATRNVRDQHHQAATAQHQYVSPPHRKSLFDFYPAPRETEEAYMSGPNSNHVDVEKVLDRALHRGSLSEEKLNRRWGGDTTKRNSPPGAAPALTFAHDPHRALWYHPHREDRGLPPVTPKRDSHRTVSSAAGQSVLGSSAKSPFRLSMGADGKDHLQLSTEYYKERLLLRSLTSVLNTP